jgi:hypothetical protein
MSATANPPGPRYPPVASLRSLGAIITGFAILTLVLTILVAAAAQVGVKECIVCTGNSCTGTGSSSCPETLIAVVTTGAFLAVESFFVSVGLSLSAFANAFGWLPKGRELGLPKGRQLALHLAAPTLMFLGWALLVLGLILPFGLFQLCHQACGYPYAPWMLVGYPLLLVEIGSVVLGAGAVLLAIVSTQIRQSRRARVLESETAVRPSGHTDDT